MKLIGVIPARYASTRMPGKPLADILGKPMIWWVYQDCLLYTSPNPRDKRQSRMPSSA